MFRKNKKAEFMLEELGFVIFSTIVGLAMILSASDISVDGAINSIIGKDTSSTTTAVLSLPPSFNIAFSPQLDVESRCVNIEDNTISAIKCENNYYGIDSYKRDIHFPMSENMNVQVESEDILYSQLTIQKFNNNLIFTSGQIQTTGDITISEQFKEKYLFISIENPNLNEIISSFDKIADPQIKSPTQNEAKVHISFTISENDKSIIKYSSSNALLLEPLAKKLNQVLIKINSQIPSSFNLEGVFSEPKLNSNEISIFLEKKFLNSDTDQIKQILGSSITSIFE